MKHQSPKTDEQSLEDMAMCCTLFFRVFRALNPFRFGHLAVNTKGQAVLWQPFRGRSVA